MGVTEADREAVRRRLREDYLFYPERAIKIVTKSGDVRPFILKQPQRRLARALMRQREAGLPQRAMILKARQVGMSTQAQGLGIQRATQMPNHVALTVAQDRTTTAALFNIGRFMWSQLPPQIRPAASYEGGTVDRKYLQWGEASLQLRRQGVLGLNSSYETATAKAAASGRGRTIRTLHLSEVAFWPHDDVLLGIVNAVPDHPDSLVLKESTANGHNFFKDEWDLAEAGASGYYAMFSPWFEEDEYRRPFATDRDMAEFEASLGAGTPEIPELGADEPSLLELIPRSIREWCAEEGVEPPPDDEIYLRTLEHLHWRRWAVANKCQGKIDRFHQEYPSTPEEAFLSTGKKVFDAVLVRRALEVAQKVDPPVPSAETPGPAVGAFVAEARKEVRARRHTSIEIPTGAIWTPRAQLDRGTAAHWRIWGAPQKRLLLADGKIQPEGQYIVSCDPASGEEDDKGTIHANHAITVIDHRTRKTVAEYESQIDPDLLAEEIFLAALYFNRAWISVERTGGYGLSILRILALDFKYPRVFESESMGERLANREDRLGFSTDSVTKPLLEALAIELLRTRPDVFTSRRVLMQMLTYVKDKRGRGGPESGKLSDVLMSWMIGQQVASLRPIRPDRPPGQQRGAGRENPGAAARARQPAGRNARNRKR